MRRDGAGFRASGSSATVAAKRSGPGRVAELDGIRALAIWAVLLFHGISTVDSAEAAGALSAGPRALFTLVAHGWLGVDLFFVLSGFLITGILLDSKHQPTYFRNFWLRRAVRILPLLFALLAVCGLAYRSHPEYFALATFFAVDFAPLLGIDGPRGMGTLWSLAVEEQFYFIWPFLVLSLSKRRLALLALAIVVCSPLIRIAATDNTWHVPWCRSDGLAIGALAALCVRMSPHVYRRIRPLTIAGAVVTVLIAIDIASHSALVSAALRISEADVIFGAAVVAAFLGRGSAVWAPLRTRSARFFAETSFCAYLVHAPLLDFWDAYVKPFPGGIFAFVGLRTVAVVVVTFGIAALSRRYLELPFLALPIGRNASEPSRAPHAANF
jgi:peptidoglycan/LPS O-acetylase OafA/YrhL